MANDVFDYARPGPFTSLESAQLRLLEGLPEDPVGICAAVQGLVIQPADAAASITGSPSTGTTTTAAGCVSTPSISARATSTVRDLAALCKQETLNWDEWGRMTAAYEGRTGTDYDQLIDEVADACAKDDPAALARLFSHGDLAVPPHLAA
ncbi:hypothetical protein [Streptomyces caniscabiei]|uniref:hypothetical protein n=1 Tax=Streptomyces caniscabiei TaxID=2746961 RepID=UPI0007660C0D|nr:hypothetical protein [Streptomyces caniscabiei]